MPGTAVVICTEPFEVVTTDARFAGPLVTVYE